MSPAVWPVWRLYEADTPVPWSRARVPWGSWVRGWAGSLVRDLAGSVRRRTGVDYRSGPDLEEES